MNFIKRIQNIILVFAAVFVLFSHICKAQVPGEIYRTINGSAGITLVLNDTILIAKSNQLFVFLNYETSEILIRLDLTTLRTDVDSIDKKIQNLNDCEWILKGKLGIPYVNTKKHGSQKINSEGTLTSFQGSHFVIGKGVLYHIPGDYLSCILTLTYKLNLIDMGIYNPLFAGINENIQVDIKQTLLKRTNE